MAKYIPTYLWCKRGSTFIGQANVVNDLLAAQGDYQQVGQWNHGPCIIVLIGSKQTIANHSMPGNVVKGADPDSVMGNQGRQYLLTS